MGLGSSELSPETQKIQRGLAKANRRMIETAAALRRNLILGNMEGDYEEKPACELLEEIKNSDWWRLNFEEDDFSSK